jgi:hypothetical protein
MRILKYGDKGTDVKTLQSILRSQGCFEYTSTGNFLDKTRSAVRYFQQTHIGPSGKFLDADGIVGSDTWWALNNPSGAPQKNSITPIIPKGLSDIRRKVLELALAEHNCKEIPDGSNQGDGVDKFVDGFGAIPWCCAFVSWVFKQATGDYPLGEHYVHCLTFWRDAKAAGKAFRKAGYKPKPGDMFVLLYKNSSGSLSGSGHIGYVLSVDRDGDKFNTIEGNAGNRVKVGTRSMDEGSLYGFIDLLGDQGDFEKALLTSDEIDSSYSATR